MAVEGEGTVVIRATPAQVLEVLKDVRAYPAWFSAHKSGEVVEEGPEGPQRVRFVVQVVGIQDTQVCDYTWSPTRVEWRLVESTQQRDQTGSYDLVDRGDGTTEARFRVSVDLKLKVPGLLVKQGQKGLVKTATDGLKKRVEALAG